MPPHNDHDHHDHCDDHKKDCDQQRDCDHKNDCDKKRDCDHDDRRNAHKQVHKENHGCDEWRFPGRPDPCDSPVGGAAGCACLKAKNEPRPCRPLAKPTGDEKIDELVDDWLRWDECKITRKQIVRLADEGNVPALTARLATRVKFGPGGIRAPMGAGFSFMNDLTVVQTSQGLLRYLRVMFQDDLQDRGIVVGYDGRHNSQRFAHRVAAVFLHARIRVRLFSEPVPVPWVPYSVRKFGSCAGVMIGASRNPKHENGYRIYWANGSQIGDPHNLGIQEAALNNLDPWRRSWDLEIATTKGDKDANPGTLANIVYKWREDPFAVVWSSYFVDIKAEIGVNPPEINVAARQRFVHTSLHGVVHKFSKELFKVMKLPKFMYAFSQFEVHPEFPSVRSPNPCEGREILEAALTTADENDVEVVAANDADGDRMAVAEKRSGDWKIFTGNELAAILSWWILRKQKLTEAGVKELGKCYMLSSSVSSKILETMARIEGFLFEEVVGGFKWIGNRVAHLMENEYKVLFAFEESLGFLTATKKGGLDKDGIAAMALLAEILAYLESEKKREEEEEFARLRAYEEEGAPPPPPEDEEAPPKEKGDWTLRGVLNQVWTLYGYHNSLASYFLCYDEDKIHEMFRRIRTMGVDGEYPDACGPYQIKNIRDLTTGYDNSQPNNSAILPVDKSVETITFTFTNRVSATFRAACGESKVKYFAELIGQPKPIPPEPEPEEGFNTNLGVGRSRNRRGIEGFDFDFDFDMKFDAANAGSAGDVANVNQAEEEAPAPVEWNLDDEKTRIRAELQAVVDEMIREWFIL